MPPLLANQDRMHPYYHSALFHAECQQIYQALKTGGRFWGVWCKASGIPQSSGVGFCWRGQVFAIHWQADLWYLLGSQLSFCAATRQELVDFCVELTRLSSN